VAEIKKQAKAEAEKAAEQVALVEEGAQKVAESKATLGAGSV
jgi:hypothetical protein